MQRELKGEGKNEPADPNKPVDSIFNLLPTHCQFSKGNRMRVTIACADADNFDTPVIDPAPRIHLLRDKDHPSFIELPLVQSR